VIQSAVAGVLIASPAMGADQGVELSGKGEFLATYLNLDDRGKEVIQDDDQDVLYEHRIGFGVRAYFGQESLESNDRHGASLHLPRYLEWNGQIAGALE
jgi:hypothetical protein